MDITEFNRLKAEFLNTGRDTVVYYPWYNLWFKTYVSNLDILFKDPDPSTESEYFITALLFSKDPWLSKWKAKEVENLYEDKWIVDASDTVVFMSAISVDESGYVLKKLNGEVSGFCSSREPNHQKYT